MGLRCSILGHTFDETEVRRDRRERGSGNEVVTVVSQVERCSRCGTERVVSENKEVVSVVDADEVGLDEEGVADAGGSRPPSDAGRAGRDTDVEPSPAGSEAGTEAEPSTDSADPDGEDVEFITETEGSLGGGEDVADDTEVPDDAARSGDAGSGLDGTAARSGAFDGSDGSDSGDPGAPAEEDAEIIDAPESDRAPGEWPDEPDGEGEGPWTPGELDGGEHEADREPTADPEPDVEPVAESSFTVPEGSLRCPDCGHEVSADSSFRAGDACPECQGYLEESAEE